MRAIFEYRDYRVFLKDRYAELKSVSKGFSYRSFAKRAGFASPNFLKLVAEGKRNLSQQSIARFAQALKLGRRERRFFECLVRMNQAKTPAEEHHYYQQLLEFPESAKARQLEEEIHEYLSHWYYPVIRELVLLPDFQEDPHWIAAKVGRRITPGAAKKALACLETLGLLQRDPAGRLTPVDHHVTTGDVARSAAAFRFHEQVLEQTKAVLHTEPPDRRDFASITTAVSPTQLAGLKDLILEFRKRILNYLSPNGDRPDAVYQLNIQLIPQTSNGGRKDTI